MAASLLVLSLLEFLLPAAFRSVLAPARLAWAIGLLLVAAAMRKTSSDFVFGSLALLGAVMCLSSLFGFALLSGGVQSPFYGWMFGVPVIAAVLARGAKFISTAMVVLTLALVWFLALREVRPPAFWSALVESSVALCVLTAVAARFFAQLRQGQLAREQERERGQANERLAVLGQLAAGVAHEINNPLSVLVSNQAFLADQLACDREEPEVKQALEDCRSSLTRIQRIVGDLRVFTRQASDAVEDCRVAEVVGESVRLASTRLRGLAEISVEVPDAALAARSNHLRLSQVLVALLLNAADAVEEIRALREPSIRVSARAVDGRVRIEVEDNGPGIPPEDLERVFEPFFTTKPPGRGTGLGLSLVREYVGRAGGTVEAHRLQPFGTRILAFLPLARTEAPAKAIDTAGD